MHVAPLIAVTLALAPPAAPPPPERLPAPFSELEPTRVPSTVFDDITIFAPKGALQKQPSCGMGECFTVTLEKGGKPLCLQFDDGPSADPSFSLYAPADVCQKAQPEWPDPLWTIGAKRVVAPGTGALYTAGQTNALFNGRRKFEVKGRQVTEVKQPFFYVGDVTKVTRQPFHEDGKPIPPVLLRADKKRTAPVVATLTEGAEVEILLAEGGDSPWFLVKTSLGLVGWHEHVSRGGVADELGIHYAGD